MADRFPKLPQRFADCETVEQLAEMLDQVMSQPALFQPLDRNAVLTKQVQIPNWQAMPCREGTLVTVTTTDAAVHADASIERRATHVVVSTLGAGRVLISPMAELLLYVGGVVSLAESGSDKYLYLTGQGKVTAVQPASGYIQRVGVVLNRDEKTGRYLCLVAPMFFGGGYVV